MEKLADLHIHTHFSDSTQSPQEVVEDAIKAELSCIAITDHDIIDGIGPAVEAAKKYQLEVIPGIELSTQINGRDVHMLGYLFDYAHPDLKHKLHSMQDTRVSRMKEMIAKLNRLGINGIELEEVCSLTESNAVGRPHLAQVLLKKKVVRSLKEAFDKYLAEGAPAFVDKYKMTPAEAIEFIHAYGGVAVLAHPMATGIDELIPQLVECGLDGLEVWYPNTSKTIMDFYEGLVKKHKLVLTGGSDAHGRAKVTTWVGKVRLPYAYVEQLKARARSSLI